MNENNNFEMELERKSEPTGGSRSPYTAEKNNREMYKKDSNILYEADMTSSAKPLYNMRSNMNYLGGEVQE